MALPTTGPMSYKRYKCTHCDNVSVEQTNHYGKIYSPCKSCSWKRPGKVTIKECLEAVPEGMGVPPDWDVVSLADVLQIKEK